MTNARSAVFFLQHGINRIICPTETNDIGNTLYVYMIPKFISRVNYHIKQIYELFFVYNDISVKIGNFCGKTD